MVRDHLAKQDMKSHKKYNCIPVVACLHCMSGDMVGDTH